jgi:hypothetical protein
LFRLKIIDMRYISAFIGKVCAKLSISKLARDARSAVEVVY